MEKPCILDFIASIWPYPVGAVPLEDTKPYRPHLLKRQTIDQGTVIFTTVPYIVADDTDNPDRNVSLYAVSRDYHIFFSEASDDIISRLSSEYPDEKFVAFCDSSPFDEVNGAARAGLGSIGDHGLLITPRYGSFSFIAEIVTTASYGTVCGKSRTDVRPKDLPVCTHCGRCARACPAHIPGRNNADKSRECLSAITQKKGNLTGEEIALIQSSGCIWGCDICQRACPLNRDVLKNAPSDTPLFFTQNRINHITYDTVAGMTDLEFNGRSYSWRGKDVIIRNCQIPDNPK